MRSTSREYKPNTYEAVLLTPAENIDFFFCSHWLMPWIDFDLNPRRLRGSDFLMRHSQGVWSENRIKQAVDESSHYFVLPYGPSGTAPEDPHEHELYFERLEHAGLGGIKRPDLLIFRNIDRQIVEDFVVSLGGEKELPFTPEEQLRELLEKAILAVEAENSLWITQRMPDYGKPLRPQRRLGGRLGLPKNAVVPTIIIKEEDLAPLRAWQSNQGLPLHIWHLFYDRAFGIDLRIAEQLIESGEISGTRQTFQAPGGATTSKLIYKIPYYYAYLLGESIETPKLVADQITDKNGHILPYVRFEGGKMTLSHDTLTLLHELTLRQHEKVQP